MPHHTATIRWQLAGDQFLSGKYSREHTWSFDGGVTVPASPAPTVVPTPWSNPACVDPEEALVAALSSCHMLTFLYLAGKAGIEVARYEDTATGQLSKNSAGQYWVSKVELHPQIAYRGSRVPTPAEITTLHHRAHEQCFIANSVKTEIVVVEAPAAG